MKFFEFIENEKTLLQQISGSILIFLGILAAVATYRTSKDRWVLSVIPMFVCSNIAEVAKTFSDNENSTNQINYYDATMTYLEWSLYLTS